MKLLIQTLDNDGRLRLVPEYLTTPWQIRVADSADLPAFAQALSDTDAVISMAWPSHFPPAPRLRLLQLPGAGLDAIAFDHVSPTAYVCNAFEHEIGISEYVIAAMLEWSIGFRHLDRRIRVGDWTGSYLCGPHHGELFGATVGIIGYGHIGREVARRAAPFGMRLLASGRQTAPGDGVVERIFGADQLDDLLAVSDFVVLAVPLTDQTRGFINQARLRVMKPNAVIINVARGAVINESDVFEALKARRIGGAVLDVWFNYPKQGETRGTAPWNLPFDQLDNVILTPHASGWTTGITARRNRVIADNLNRLARGEPLINVVRVPRSH